jgi:hypothetical protein
MPSLRLFSLRDCRRHTLFCAATLLVALAMSSSRCFARDHSLPDAPEPQTVGSAKHSQPMIGAGRDNTVFGIHVGPAYPLHPDDKWDTYVYAGQQALPFSARDKLIFAAHSQILPVVLVPGLFSAGWGQLTDANPHYGVDAGGFGERFGAAMLRQATDRLTGDGLLAAAFHQDPRYYRVTHGPIKYRGLHAVRQTYLRRCDDGVYRVNASGILGHAAANFLAMTYYPEKSANASVAAQGFATSIAADMGSKLLLEFGPDLLRLAFRRNQ